jgi:SNF2 family DNA or RNA helicase
MSKRLAGSVSKYCVWRRLLTGTPVDNSPLKYYSICNVIKPGLLGYTRVKDFQYQYANWRVERSNARMFERVTSYKNLDELVAKVRVFSSMVKREDCVDLPRTILIDRKFHLTPQQISLIEEVEIREKQKTMSRDAAVPAIQAISSGIGVEGLNPRMDALLELLEESDEKVLVWCRFVREIEMLREAIGDRAVCYYGDVSRANRQLAISKFQSDPATRVFIGQPQAAGEGLRLSTAGYVVWYSHTWDATVCTQASKRAIQMGGKDIPVYRLTAVGARDDVILRNLKTKRNTVNSMESEWRRQDGR